MSIKKISKTQPEFFEFTKDNFKKSELEIKKYVESGDPMDKAGSYAIQNELFHPVEAIKGCYFSVVGLPVCNLLKILTQLNLKSIIDVDKNQLNFEMCTKCVMLCSAGKS